MEIKVLENSKTRLMFELKGKSHSFCNTLKDELWNDDSVKVSAYNIKHPLIGVPYFIVETNGKKTASEAVQDAVKKLQKVAEKAKKSASSILK